MASSKPWLALMVTTEIEALRGLADSRPGLLIVLEQLEQGSGLALVVRARQLVSDVRTSLMLAGPHDGLVTAGPSGVAAALRNCWSPTASALISRW